MENVALDVSSDAELLACMGPYSQTLWDLLTYLLLFPSFSPLLQKLLQVLRPTPNSFSHQGVS